jgi:uncharacterized membrane protein YdbT with pleckstrin-like domain
MKKLDSKAVWLFFITSILRSFFFLLFLSVWIFFISIGAEKGLLGSFPLSGLLLWAIVPAYLIFLWAWAKLTYIYYRYELKDEGFRKERGVIWKKYVTIPYSRIQNVDIYRGVVARILGLSDLHIQTAGASAQMSRWGAWGMGAEGRLPGLAKEVAEQVRDELIKRAGRGQNQGL